MKLLIVVAALCAFASLASAQNVSASAYASLSVSFIAPNGTVYKYLLANFSAIFTLPFYNASRLNVLYSPGWNCDYNSTTFIAVRDAYLAAGQYNFFVADWFAYNKGCYFQMVNNVRPIAVEYAKAFVAAWNGTVHNSTNWHFVGHSISAQLFGFIGRNIQLFSNRTYIVPRITALDPAGPLFHTLCNVALTLPLCKTDATFVDVVHTDTWFASTSAIIGHQDSFPNQGAWQRGCPVVSIINLIFNLNATAINDALACSHNRAPLYWAESVRNATAFAMAAGTTYCTDAYVFGWLVYKCPAPPANAYFGASASISLSGTYVFRTNAVANFGLGSVGAFFTALWQPFV